MENELQRMQMVNHSLFETSHKLHKTNTTYDQYGENLSSANKLLRAIHRTQIIQNVIENAAMYIFFGVCVYIFWERFYIWELVMVAKNISLYILSSFYSGAQTVYNLSKEEIAAESTFNVTTFDSDYTSEDGTGMIEESHIAPEAKIILEEHAKIDVSGDYSDPTLNNEVNPAYSDRTQDDTSASDSDGYYSPPAEDPSNLEGNIDEDYSDHYNLEEDISIVEDDIDHSTTTVEVDEVTFPQDDVEEIDFISTNDIEDKLSIKSDDSQFDTQQHPNTAEEESSESDVFEEVLAESADEEIEDL